ncbi:MAG TPA: HD domain-containing phosphohydrolase [Fimbriimonadaceae bacterium]|jgi:diguanylate cyclase (GGDEF)-like protein/putative nucleotidyltransferase with HDIG domain
MSKLPALARLYMAAVFSGAALVVVALALHPFPAAHAAPWEFAVFIALGVLAGGKKIAISRKHDSDDGGSMSLGFAIAFAALLRFGLLYGVVIGALSCLSSCIYPKRQALHQILFNVGLTLVEGFLGGLAFIELNGGVLGIHIPQTFGAVTVSSIVFFIVNTGGVSIIISLCSSEKVGTIWKENFLWTAPSYFATASISALAFVVLKDSFTGILLFVAPVAYLVYQSYSVSIARSDEKQKHIEELQFNQAELADLYLATIKSLALAIDAKDQYTHQHILRVQRYAVAIAVEMGLKGSDLEAVNTGALLHDIGKLGVPEYVLLKPGRLTPDEFDMIKKHPEIGAAILGPVKFPWPVLPVVRHHHEKLDGTGYPDGLKGDEIPLSARIMAVADVYDALTSSRSYRRAWAHEKALGIIVKDAGTHFDPQVVEAFTKVVVGVIEEMAREGEGPLVEPTEVPEIPTVSEAADVTRVAAELWALYEVAQMLSSGIGSKDTCHILGRKLIGIFGGTSCVIMLAPKEGGRLKVASVSGINAEFFMGGAALSENSLSEKVLRERETFVGEYDQDDLMLTSNDSALWTELRSGLIVPLELEGEPIGTINVYSPRVNYFTEYDKQLLEMIALRASRALRNGILFDRDAEQTLEDPLTSLANLSQLTLQLDGKCREYSTADIFADHNFAVLCIDLDNFKSINDNFGHQKGDRVLQQVADCFKSMIGPTDFAARYGGDEFVIILEPADRSAAETICRMITDSVEQLELDLVHESIGQIHLGMSVGIAVFPQDGKDSAALIAAADHDMYQNKSERKLKILSSPVHTKKRKVA